MMSVKLIFALSLVIDICRKTRSLFCTDAAKREIMGLLEKDLLKSTGSLNFSYYIISIKLKLKKFV